MAASVSVRAVGDSERQCWDEFVHRHPSASFYHRYAWRDLIEEVFGRETHYLGAFQPSGGISGVLPVVRLKSWLFGDFLVSLPYVNYGGIAAADLETEHALAEAGVALAQSLGVEHLELRHTEDNLKGLATRTDRVVMNLTLPASPDDLFASLTSKVRSQIRRPQKAGATARLGGAELVGDFYSVFSRNMRDLGTPVYPRRFFEAVLHTFQEEARICTVSLDERPVAAGLVLSDGRTLEIPWASSLRRANRVSVNMLLYWKLLTHAVETGHIRFDFGRCSIDSGTYRFKKQWGAEPQQLYWHYWLRDGQDVPHLNPDNPRYRILVSLWQRQPLPLANLIGPRIVRNLP